MDRKVVMDIVYKTKFHWANGWLSFTAGSHHLAFSLGVDIRTVWEAGGRAEYHVRDELRKLLAEEVSFELAGVPLYLFWGELVLDAFELEYGVFNRWLRLCREVDAGGDCVRIGRQRAPRFQGILLSRRR